MGWLSCWADNIREVKFVVWPPVPSFNLSILIGLETIHLWVASEALRRARQAVESKKVRKYLNLTHWVVVRLGVGLFVPVVQEASVVVRLAPLKWGKLCEVVEEQHDDE